MNESIIIKENNSVERYNKKMIPRDFTQRAKFIDWFWLCGFIQGDGSFVIRKTRTEFIIYISQSIEDLRVLHLIKDFLKVGNIRLQSKKKMAHWYVQKQEDIIYVLKNLKGCFFSSKLDKYYLFLNKFELNVKCLDNFLSFSNSWLIGFIEADGSFYASFCKNKKMRLGYQLQLRFAITQKDLYVIKPIASLFNKKVKYNKKGFYYFIITDMKNLEKLINYVDNYKFFSKKALSYKKWKKLYYIYSTKQHLELKPEYLKKKVESINKHKKKSDPLWE